MSNEELLKPRYKVNNEGYPGCEGHGVRPGDIIVLGTRYECDRKQDEHGTPIVAIDHEKFPSIFRKLEWWEFRKPEDMPKYVKIVDDWKDEFVYVDGRDIFWRWQESTGDLFGLQTVTGGGQIIGANVLPITEEEYNAYTQTPQK